MKYRVAFEGCSGEVHVVEVDASNDQEAVESATAKYDPLHLAASSRIADADDAKGTYFNRSFVITVKK